MSKLKIFIGYHTLTENFPISDAQWTPYTDQRKFGKTCLKFWGYLLVRFLYNKNGSWSLNSILFVIGSVIFFIFSLFIMKKALEGGVDLKNGLHTTRLIIYHIKIWQLSWRGATGELEVEFKFQRPSCKLSFLFPPHRQSTPDSLLPG